MKARSACLSVPQLEALYAGKLSSDESERVRAHCERCSPCLVKAMEVMRNAQKLKVGQILPERYTLTAKLGSGGMGEVWEARDHSGALVAIKVLKSQRGDDGSAGQLRLLREAQAMAQLAHPNVVPVYDSGPFGNGIFIAMELVQGTTLDHWTRQRRSWREVLPVFIAAGRGLEAAHAKGLIHRDFKPANVLLGSDGRPRVTDFGLARATRASGSSPSLELHDPMPWDDATRQAWQDAYRAIAAAMRRGLSSGTLTRPDLSPLAKTAGG